MIAKLRVTVLAVVLVSILFTGGCDKKDDPTVSKCLLTEIVGTETSSTFAYDKEGNPTYVTYNFEEGGNPVILVITATVDTNGNLSKTEMGSYSETYLYDDHNRLTETKHFYDEDFTYGVRYVYNSSSQLIKTETYEFSSSGNEIINAYATYDYISTVSKNALRKSNYGLYNSSYVLSNIYEYEYDDRKKPYPHTLAYNLDYVFSDENPSENNIITVTLKNSSGSIGSIYAYSYQFNENGYPTVRTGSRVGSTIEETTTYSYQCM